MTRRSIGSLLAAASAVLVAGCVGSGTTRTDADVVNVFGPYRGEEADRFVESLEPFVERTGVRVRYTGTNDFVRDIRARSGEGGGPPDVAIVPQPGLVHQLAEDGLLVELSEEAREGLAANYSSEAAALGEVDGVAFGVPFRVNVKSVVWYRPDVLRELGLQIPQTLDELIELTARIAAVPDIEPWCLTLESGTATGWPATDWIEDLVVRQQGADVYTRWAQGDIAFASPPIEQAFDTFDELVLTRGRLFGGRIEALERSTDRIFDALLEEPNPGCAMAKQADFAVSWLPDDTVIGPEGLIDWFVLPGRTADASAPLVVGGDLAIQFRSNSRVDQLMAFLASDQAGESWARRGGLISPRTTFDPSHYPDETARAFAELVVTAETLVFDASDLMPPDVGTTTYWSTMSAWIAGQISYDQLSASLDQRFTEVRSGSVVLPSG